MINYLIAVIFVLTIAFTSGGILLSTYLRSSYKLGFFSALLFFQVFYFTFGFYAIWGQFLVSSMLSSLISLESVERIKDFTLLLGLPFLALSFIMFIRFIREACGRSINRTIVIILLIINIILIFSIGFIFVKYPAVDTFLVVKYYFFGLCLIMNASGIIILLQKGNEESKLEISDRKRLAAGISVLTIAQLVVLVLYEESIFLALAFILLYYVNGIFIPLYLRYLADMSSLLPKSKLSKSFEQFCKDNEISKRETEIIYEICEGLTNQQIADKLFISLQTVKDHTHRIYYKTNCANRTQLIKLVGESLSSSQADIS